MVIHATPKQIASYLRLFAHGTFSDRKTIMSLTGTLPSCGADLYPAGSADFLSFQSSAEMLMATSTMIIGWRTYKHTQSTYFLKCAVIPPLLQHYGVFFYGL